MSTAILTSGTIGRAEQFSTRVAFFIAGFGGAVWAGLVPFAKTRTGLEAGGLGLLLLAFGIGSIVAMPLAGALAGKYGCRRVLIASSLMVCLALPALAIVSSAPLLAVALFILGAGVGSVDCVVNIQAVIVERAAGKALMSGFHGLFSVGGIVGAGGCALILSLDASPLTVSLIAIVFTAGLLVWAAPHFLGFGGGTSGPAFALPRGVVLFIGILCFIVFLTEGSVLDWSAVFITSVRGGDPNHAGFGYAAFATTMTIGRLSGDAIVRRISRTTIILVGGLLAASGLLVATLVPSVPAAMIGFAMIGAGCSNIVPVLYSAIGKQTLMPESVAVPAVTTLGYAGILMGPAAIGFVAHVASLPTAFLIVSVFLIGVAASGRFLKV
ncbi:MFS transporter [Pleomorphomonas sp. JP5]|uniref:MFS transporter n=1 Tax=Pleomorphomonas sp. JP5 TaxID=2942998 RepID=UPI002044A2EC|nr:MFS transporter [Pleomorphomonas sp. JP5]MCM5557090.1 MFS transporter [Pleomorphomonas sp. JP5]